MPATPARATVRFVSKLSGITLSQDTGAAESWHQVAIAGDFKDPGRYGEFSISVEDLAAMAANFNEGRFPEPPTEICVDYDHLTLKVKQPGDGKAAGWFRELQTRNNGTELWARIAWNESGAQAIRSGEYRYFSPVIRWGYTTDKGQELSAVLWNGALTNTPFLQGMQPLALSATADAELLVLAAVLTDNDKRARLDEAIRQRFASLDDRYGCWLVDTEGDVAIYYDRGKYWRIGYALGRDGSVSFLGDPVEAVVNYPALSATGGRPLMSKNLITLTAATGGDVQIDPAQLESLDLVKALRAKLPKDGEVVVAADKMTALEASVAALQGNVTTLQANLTAETEKRQAVEKSLSLTKSADAVDSLIRAGKATPAERESLVKLHQKDEALFVELTSTRTVIVPLQDPKGHGDNPQAQDAQAKLDAAVQAQLAANPKLTKQQAMDAALSADPKLYVG